MCTLWNNDQPRKTVNKIILSVVLLVGNREGLYVWYCHDDV